MTLGEEGEKGEKETRAENMEGMTEWEREREKETVKAEVRIVKLR